MIKSIFVIFNERKLVLGPLEVKVKVKVKPKKFRNKLGLSWTKLSSSWDWTLILGLN